MEASAPEPASPSVYPRGSEEFSRVLAFSDGLFAIAMTLLVVGIAVPALEDPDSVRELANRLDDLSQEIISFFVSFAVIGRYWVAHHSFVARLGWMDGRFVGLNLVFLAFVAFLPFPTAVLGDYFDNPLSVVVYALTIAVVSGLEVVMLLHAQRRGLMREAMNDDDFRWEVLQSAAPVGFFLLSIPLAFWSSIAAVVCWFMTGPFEAIASRYRSATEPSADTPPAS